MSGVGLQFDLQNFQAVQRRVQEIMHIGDHTDDLLDAIGAEVETQVRRRIADEKMSPSGEHWKPWSEPYAATREAGQSLLMSEGHLVQSIDHQVDDGAVEIGSPLVYAAIQNFGGAKVGKPGLPAREYLGLSEENRQDVHQVASDWLDAHLNGGAL